MSRICPDIKLNSQPPSSTPLRLVIFQSFLTPSGRPKWPTKGKQSYQINSLENVLFVLISRPLLSRPGGGSDGKLINGICRRPIFIKKPFLGLAYV